MNCMRPNSPSMEAASAFARLVLPTPGTSSSSRWPSGHEAQHDELDDLVLALDDLGDVAGDPVEELGEGAGLLGGRDGTVSWAHLASILPRGRAERSA